MCLGLVGDRRLTRDTSEVVNPPILRWMRRRKMAAEQAGTLLALTVGTTEEPLVKAINEAESPCTVVLFYGLSLEQQRAPIQVAAELRSAGESEVVRISGVNRFESPRQAGKSPIHAGTEKIGKSRTRGRSLRKHGVMGTEAALERGVV